MEDMLEAFDGDVSHTRNATPLSTMCESLVSTFVKNNAAVAKVRWDRSGYGADAMYRCLWQIAQKDCWRHSVWVHRQNGLILLVRKKEGR